MHRTVSHMRFHYAYIVQWKFRSTIRRLRGGGCRCEENLPERIETSKPETEISAQCLKKGKKPFDLNNYQQKKNLAQGMMDLALLSANANQLRYVMESSKTDPYYWPSLILIGLSILFQVAVGVGLILNSRFDVRLERHMTRADTMNNWTVVGVFVVTLVNVFIASFCVAPVATYAA